MKEAGNCSQFDACVRFFVGHDYVDPDPSNHTVEQGTITYMHKDRSTLLVV